MNHIQKQLSETKVENQKLCVSTTSKHRSCDSSALLSCAECRLDCCIPLGLPPVSWETQTCGNEQVGAVTWVGTSPSCVLALHDPQALNSIIMMTLQERDTAPSFPGSGT